MKGVTVYQEDGKKFAIWQAHLRDEMYGCDGRGNPLLWWSKDLRSNDYMACGVRTKRECLEISRADAIE